MQNPLDFTGKVALITGAGSGMGLAAARLFAESGASVVLSDYDEGSIRNAATQLVAEGYNAIAVRCDVSIEEQVETMVGRTVAEFGRLDAAFNNAGTMAKAATIAEGVRDEWERVIGVNLRGVWTCMKYEIRQMKRQGTGGTIVNNASIGAMNGHPGISPYIASKHGVVGLTRTAALECIKDGIRVNALNTGTIDTKIAQAVVEGDDEAYRKMVAKIPIGRIGKPEEVAAAALWLSSPASSFVVGHALVIDGGQMVQ